MKVCRGRRGDGVGGRGGEGKELGGKMWRGERGVGGGEGWKSA